MLNGMIHFLTYGVSGLLSVWNGILNI